MQSGATINVRIDPETKNEAQNILGALGLNMSQAVVLFFRQVVLQKQIPFEIKLPNELTAKTLKQSQEGKGLNEVAGVDELMKALNS